MSTISLETTRGGMGSIVHESGVAFRLWRLRLNSDWNGYSRAFGNQACSDVVAEVEPSVPSKDMVAPKRDGFPAAGTIQIGPYSVLVFSQDPVVNQ